MARILIARGVAECFNRHGPLASYRTKLWLGCLLVPMSLRTAMAMSPLVMTVPMKERG